MRRIPALLILAAVAACGREAQQTGRAQPGQAADSELTVAGDTVEAMNTGIELEAPRLIPGLRAQLQALGDSGAGLTEGNVTAYKNLAADVVTAMLSDLNRIGSSEVGPLRELGDTVLNLVGGGTGVSEADRPELTRSVRLMERMIQRYQEAMRAVQS